MDNHEDPLRQMQDALNAKISEETIKIVGTFNAIQQKLDEKDKRIDEITNRYTEAVTENDQLHARINDL